jgi:hypothetical protein
MCYPKDVKITKKVKEIQRMMHKCLWMVGSNKKIASMVVVYWANDFQNI